MASTLKKMLFLAFPLFMPYEMSGFFVDVDELFHDTCLCLRGQARRENNRRMKQATRLPEQKRLLEHPCGIIRKLSRSGHPGCLDTPASDTPKRGWPGITAGRTNTAAPKHTRLAARARGPADLPASCESIRFSCPRICRLISLPHLVMHRWREPTPRGAAESRAPRSPREGPWGRDTSPEPGSQGFSITTHKLSGSSRLLWWSGRGVRCWHVHAWVLQDSCSSEDWLGHVVFTVLILDGRSRPMPVDS